MNLSIYHPHRLYENHSFTISPFDNCNRFRGVTISFRFLRAQEEQTIDACIRSIIADFNLCYMDYGLPHLDIGIPLEEWYDKAFPLFQIAQAEKAKEYEQWIKEQNASSV